MFKREKNFFLEKTKRKKKYKKEHPLLSFWII